MGEPANFRNSDRQQDRCQRVPSQSRDKFVDRLDGFLGLNIRPRNPICEWG
jgi:hypothetical protein